MEDRTIQDAPAPFEQSERHSPAPENEKEEWIGQQLRAVYDETLSEPIPDRFLELLDKIDKTDPGSK